MTHGPTPPATSLLVRILNPLEKVCIAGVAAGVIFKIIHLPGADETIMLSMSILSCVFFLNAYQPLQPVGPQNGKHSFGVLLAGTIVPKIGWIGCAIVTTGLMFTVLHLKGASEMLFVGSFAVTVGGAVAAYVNATGSAFKGQLNKLLYRAAPLAALGWNAFMKLQSVGQ